MIKRLALGGAAAAVTVAALFLGGVLREAGSAAPAPVFSVASAASPDAVVRLQDELRAHPNDVRSLGLLGLAYQQRARETGDPSFYAKSAGVLRRAVTLAPDDLVATSGLGSLALARHRFREALGLGKRAIALSPSTARSYGVAGDALVELGRYREAFAAFDRMAALRPSLAAYARSLGDAARRRLGSRGGRAERMDARPAREALLEPRPPRRCGTRVPRRARGVSRLRLRVRRTRAG
jgi:tetratricopeptide (TPR) repeat protein